MVCTTHISQVHDEAVSLVEAVPADRHLRCPDNTPTFDLQHTLHGDLIGDDVPEPRSHASFLEHKEATKCELQRIAASIYSIVLFSAHKSVSGNPESFDDLGINIYSIIFTPDVFENTVWPSVSPSICPSKLDIGQASAGRSSSSYSFMKLTHKRPHSPHTGCVFNLNFICIVLFFCKDMPIIYTPGSKWLN